MTSSDWRRRLRNAGIWGLLVLVALIIGGLSFVLPIVLALHSRGTTAVEYAVAPVTVGSLAFAVTGHYWLKAPLRRPAASSRYEIGASQRRLQRYQARASKVRVVAALLAYYLPAVLVTIRHQGTVGLSDYFHGHVLDGFGFIGFLASGWQLITRDIHLAAERLTQSSVLIAVAGAFVAGGTPLEIAFAGFFGELFFERVWQAWVTAGPPSPAEATSSSRKYREINVRVARPEGNSLHAGQQLLQQHCLQSDNGRYRLIMWNGQLAIWGPDDTKAIWATGTEGSGATHAALDDAGRLRLCDADQTMVAWQSPVPGGNANILRLEDDGVLAAYRPDGTKAWGTLPVPVPNQAERFSFEFVPPGTVLTISYS